MSATLPAARAPISDQGGGISREWYRFFLELLGAIPLPESIAAAISSFSISPSVAEIGSTVTAVNAAWVFNHTMTEAALTDTTIDTADVAHAFTGLTLTTNKSYTLTCGDGLTSASATRTLSFSHKRYWGASASTSLDSAGILALASEYSSARSKTVTYDCTGGKYPYYCYPASLGDPAGVMVGGLAFSAYTVTAQNFTNASGNTTSFNVVRFDGIQYGAAITVSWN